MLHGKELVTLGRVVRAYAAKKGLTVTLDIWCTAETIDLLLKEHGLAMRLPSVAEERGALHLTPHLADTAQAPNSQRPLVRSF